MRHMSSSLSGAERGRATKAACTSRVRGRLSCSSSRRERSQWSMLAWMSHGCAEREGAGRACRAEAEGKAVARPAESEGEDAEAAEATAESPEEAAAAADEEAAAAPPAKPGK